MEKRKSFKMLIMSMLAIIISITMLLGSTFAYFTDSATLEGNKIVSGTLKVDLELLNKEDGKWNSLKEDKKPLFNYVKWEPGYTEVRVLKIENEGSLALKWKAKFISGGELSQLADVIDVYVRPSATELSYPDDRTLEGYVNKGTIREFVNSIEETTNGVLPAGEVSYLGLALKMKNVGNDYQGLDLCGSFDIAILATQVSLEEDGFNDEYDSGAEYPQLVTKWNGTADTSWYNETDTTFTLTTAEQFAGFAKIVGTKDQFEGKTVNLGGDIDLTLKEGAITDFGTSFAPIGSTGERDGRNRLAVRSFKGTFDGTGHTISNLSQSGWDFGYEWGQYGSLGLFAELESATVKNVVIEGFDCAVEGGDIAFIAGSATGDCTFENIQIISGGIGTYNNGIGSIIGWSGMGTYNFKNIEIGEDVILGGLWGSFDSSVGGLVGQGEPGATYNFENVDVACQLDVFNDCTASYDYYNYRMSGMLIGRLAETTTIDGVNYPDTSKYNITCKDVTVTYGEWANYSYCRGSGRAQRVEPGYAYDGLPSDYDHSQCTTHCKEVIPFDQIFGGDQYAVKGIKAYEGVTVIYNNDKE